MENDTFNQIAQTLKDDMSLQGVEYATASNDQLLGSLIRNVRGGKIDKIDARFWAARVGIEYQASWLSI